MSDPCPICGNADATISSIGNADAHLKQVDCQRCGLFSIESSAGQQILEAKFNGRKQAIMSSTVRSGFSHITLENMNELCEAKDKAPLEKLDLLLLYLYSKIDKIGASIELRYSNSIYQGSLEQTKSILEFVAMSWALDESELRAMFELITSMEYVNRLSSIGQDHQFTITHQGLQRIAELQQVNKDSQQGFVAMWFGDEVTAAFDKAICPAIEAAGYEPMRIDRKEHTNDINDEMIMEIRRSRFMVADFTDQRHGVYYEAGFAKGLGLEVIWTCREDHLNKTHFDNSHNNYILWSNNKLGEFKDALHRRIEAVLGHGPATPSI